MVSFCAIGLDPWRTTLCPGGLVNRDDGAVAFVFEDVDTWVFAFGWQGGFLY